MSAEVPLESRRPATYQDVLDAPEHMLAELIGGELFLQPRPAKPHTLAATLLAGLLVPPFHLGRGGPGGWHILAEPEMHWREEVLVPDLAGWRREATPSFDMSLPYYTERPDWVCEVASPGTARKDRILKMTIYHQMEVRHAWLVDPAARTVEVYAHHPDGWLRRQVGADQDAVALAPFEALELELPLLWGDDPKPAH